jgi:TonB-linked SusC/RagA family outer membrane protein
MKQLLHSLLGATLTLAAVLTLTAPAASAQDRRVTGRITNGTDAQPVPGATVQVKGTTTGTAADANGNYAITVGSGNDVLVISAVGFVSQQVTVGSQSVVNVGLKEDAGQLSEVVVTGYSTQQKKDLTGAVAVVNPKELLSVPAANFGQQLQGRVAGVQVNQDNSPGGATTIRIRGFGTLGNNDPLYVIDGVPTQENLNNLNQNDIESIQILKDATSASIYGSRASNGVVIITTKKGKTGEPRVTFDAYYGTQTPRVFLPVLNTQEYGQYLWASKKNAGVVNATTGNPEQAQYGNGPQPVIPDYIVPDGAKEGDPRVNPANYSIDRFTNPNFGKTVFQITRANKTGTDWQREIIKPAPIQNYQVGVTGGTGSANYALSLGYFNQQGMVIYNNFKRYSIRANSQFTVKKHFRIGENLQVLLAERLGGYRNEDTEGNAIFMALRMQPIVPVYDIAGNFAGTLGSNLGNASSPVANLYRARQNGYRDFRVFGNAFAEVDIARDFTARTSFGLDATVARGTYPGFPSPEVSEPSRTYSLYQDFQYRYSWTWTNTLNYKHTFANVHNISAYVGVEAIKAFGESQNGFRNNYYSGDPALRYLDTGDPQAQSNGGSAFIDYTLFSYFGQASYSYKDKYILQGTIRRDASSRFLQASRYATFPAVSAGWRISEEPFIKDNLAFINDLKLRAGWGQTGNQNIGDYNAYTTYTADLYTAGYSLNGNPNGYNQGFAIQRFGNPNAKWETNTSTNFGADARFLGGALEVNLDVWNRKTTNLLYTRARPYTGGQGDLPAENVASLQNRGIDLQLSYRGAALNNQVRYTVSGNFSTYRNKVLQLDPDSPDQPLLGFGTRLPAVTRSVVGQPISLFYGYVIDGIFQSAEEAAAAPKFPGYNDATVFINGQPVKGIGKFKYRDVNGDGQITADDQTFIGNPHPKFTYGLNVNVGYKAFDLTLFGQGVYGNDIFNYVRYWTDFNTFQGNRSTRVLYDSWTPTNPGAKLPILDENDALSSRPSSYFVEKGSYFRLKNVQLTYTVPGRLASRLGLSTARVYVQSTNLLTFTKYSGLDPEVYTRYVGSGSDAQLGMDEGRYPAPRNFIFGLSFGF